jgi:hypothetical protein
MGHTTANSHRNTKNTNASHSNNCTKWAPHALKTQLQVERAPEVAAPQQSTEDTWVLQADEAGKYRSPDLPLHSYVYWLLPLHQE